MVMISLLVAMTLVTDRPWDDLDMRIRNADPTNGLHRFVNFHRGAMKDQFTPNPLFWAKGVDLSCASPWNSMAGAFRAGTAISKRHIVFAKHYPLAIGTRMLFVGDDGGVCPVRLKSSRAIEGCDIVVGLLDAELTPNIHPARILPVNAKEIIPQWHGIPVLALDQQERAIVNDISVLEGTNGFPSVFCKTPESAQRKKFSRQFVGGDSGNPCFLIVGNEVVLLFCLRGGLAGSGPSLLRFRHEIQKTMDELCPGYKLEELDQQLLKERKLW